MGSDVDHPIVESWGEEDEITDLFRTPNLRAIFGIKRVHIAVGVLRATLLPDCPGRYVNHTVEYLGIREALVGDLLLPDLRTAVGIECK